MNRNRSFSPIFLRKSVFFKKVMSIPQLFYICKVRQAFFNGVTTMYMNYLERILRFLFVIIIIAIGYFVVKYSFIYLYPFIIAILCAIILHPFVSILEMKLKFPRSVATLVILLIFLCISSFFIAAIVSELIQGTTFLATKIPVHFQDVVTLCTELFYTKVLPLYEKLAALVHSLDSSQQQAINDNLEKVINQFTASGTMMIKMLLLKIPETLSILPSSLTIFTVTLFSTFLVTKDWYQLQKIKDTALPFLNTKIVMDVCTHIKSSLLGLLRAQVILIFLTAASIYIGLMILDINYALTIAILAALLDLLPYIGTGVIFIPWIGYSFLTANYSLTIQLSILYMVIVVVRQLVEPKLLSASIGLNPLATLLTMFVTLNLWGVVGLIISPFLLIIWNSCHRAGVFEQLILFIKGT